MQVNGKIFDSTLAIGVPRTLRIDDIIEGWKEAMKYMREGSKFILYIPGSLAYGNHTGHGSFPANSTLVFEIELLKVIH